MDGIRRIDMWPDYGYSLFWDKGCNIGDPDSIYIDNLKVDLSSISGLREWLLTWDTESFYNPSNWDKEKWIEWWKEGYHYAVLVKELLPENVELYYFSITDKVWEVWPEDSNDGGYFDEGEPIKIDATNILKPQPIKRENTTTKEKNRI